MPLSRALRTDPSLYEWDRLSPEQKAAVLAAIGDLPRPSSPWRSLRPLLIVAVVAILLMLLGAVLIIVH